MMANRKSLGHALVDNADNTSLNSPLRRRSSFGGRQVDFNVNDDDAERAALRHQTTSTTNNRRSISLDVVTDMSSPQVAAGLAECIKLNTQNKINIKNAFNLNMIDFMSYMVRNRGDGIPNLQVAATSLDVSAKIYALRVDGLHQQILRMVGNLDPEDQNQNTNNANEDNIGNGDEADPSQTLSQTQKKKKKKKKNMNILTTQEALCNHVIDKVSLAPPTFGDFDCQTSNTLYQAMLPQHCVPSLALHPFNDVFLDEEFLDENNKNNERRIMWPPIQIDGSKEMNMMFSDFEFLDKSTEDDNSNSPTPLQSQEVDNDQLAFDLDASLPPENMPDDDTDFYEINADRNDYDDGDEHQVGCHNEIRAPVRIANLDNILDQMPITNQEYSFFSTNLDIRWIGPSHWKIKSLIKNPQTSIVQANKQVPMKNKKDVKLVYSEKIGDELSSKFVISKNGQCRLKPKTLKFTWTEERLLLQEKSSDNTFNDHCKYYVRPNDIISFKKINNFNHNETVLDDDVGGEYNYDNVNDSINHCPNDDNDDILGDNEVPNDYMPEEEPLTNGFVGTNLIEVPKLTQKLFIPFTQRAKKLDMRNLKKCIWKQLTVDETNDKENVETNDKNIEAASVVKEEKSFAKIYEQLPAKLKKNDAEELSFPIAFVSLLHLANEKCLKLLNNDDFSDITVRQDVP